MSEEVKSYQESFQPMPAPPAPEPAPEYTASVESLRQAGRDLQAGREVEAPILERQYQYLAGEHKGEPRPINETIDIERAAKDLADLRRAEADAQEVLANHARQKEIDADRQAAIDALPPVEPRPAATPEPAQPKSKVQAALEDPEIRSAIEQQVAQSEQARQQYMQSVQQLGNTAVANVLAQFPELQQGNPQQVLEQMRMQNPARFAEIAGHLAKVQQIGQHWQALQQQQQVQAAQQFEQYSQQADSEFEDFANSRPPGEAKAVRARAIDFAVKELGVDEKTLLHLWQTNPIIRSPQMQKMLYMATAYAMARDSVPKRGSAPVPKVFRPGVSEDHMTGESVIVANKMRQFAADPTAKNAGAALAARRRAAALNRR
jgi:hypothetical protein